MGVVDTVEWNKERMCNMDKLMKQLDEIRNKMLGDDEIDTDSCLPYINSIMGTVAAAVERERKIRDALKKATGAAEVRMKKRQNAFGMLVRKGLQCNVSGCADCAFRNLDEKSTDHHWCKIRDSKGHTPDNTRWNIEDTMLFTLKPYTIRFMNPDWDGDELFTLMVPESVNVQELKECLVESDKILRRRYHKRNGYNPRMLMDYMCMEQPEHGVWQTEYKGLWAWEGYPLVSMHINFGDNGLSWLYPDADAAE